MWVYLWNDMPRWYLSRFRLTPAEKPPQHVFLKSKFFDMPELLVIKLTFHTQNLTKSFKTIKCPYKKGREKILIERNREDVHYLKKTILFSVVNCFMWLNETEDFFWLVVNHKQRRNWSQQINIALHKKRWNH